MPTRISELAQVDPAAQIGVNVQIGPFCRVEAGVVIGDDSVLQSHVVLTGIAKLGTDNYCHPNVVIGGIPQDLSDLEGETRIIIGDKNVFREGVTVNRGASKEDGITRIGSGNLLMSNSHVAHNCHLRDNIILVNGVLLGGHVHVHDGAIVSGHSVVHHFSTLGTLSFVSGGCRVPHDIAPFMLAAGSDNPAIKTVNIIGLRRNGFAESTISVIKQAHRLLYRQNKPLIEVRAALEANSSEPLPAEVEHLLQFVTNQQKGRLGRAREAVRDNRPHESTPTESESGRAA